MKLTTFTIFLTLLSAFGLAAALSRFRRDRAGIVATLTWAVLWIGIAFFALAPNLLDGMMRLAQMENRMFFITVIGLLVVFGLSANTAAQVDELRRDVARLIQNNALHNGVDGSQIQTSDKTPND